MGDKKEYVPPVPETAKTDGLIYPVAATVYTTSPYYPPRAVSQAPIPSCFSFRTARTTAAAPRPKPMDMTSEVARMVADIQRKDHAEYTKALSGKTEANKIPPMPVTTNLSAQKNQPTALVMTGSQSSAGLISSTMVSGGGTAKPYDATKESTSLVNASTKKAKGKAKKTERKTQPVKRQPKASRPPKVPKGQKGTKTQAKTCDKIPTSTGPSSPSFTGPILSSYYKIPSTTAQSWPTQGTSQERGINIPGFQNYMDVARNDPNAVATAPVVIPRMRQPTPSMSPSLLTPTRPILILSSTSQSLVTSTGPHTALSATRPIITLNPINPSCGTSNRPPLMFTSSRPIMILNSTSQGITTSTRPMMTSNSTIRPMVTVNIAPRSIGPTMTINSITRPMMTLSSTTGPMTPMITLNPVTRPMGTINSTSGPVYTLNPIISRSMVTANSTPRPIGTSNSTPRPMLTSNSPVRPIITLTPIRPTEPSNLTAQPSVRPISNIFSTTTRPVQTSSPVQPTASGMAFKSPILANYCGIMTSNANGGTRMPGNVKKTPRKSTAVAGHVNPDAERAKAIEMINRTKPVVDHVQPPPLTTSFLASVNVSSIDGKIPSVTLLGSSQSGANNPSIYTSTTQADGSVPSTSGASGPGFIQLFPPSLFSTPSTSAGSQNETQFVKPKPRPYVRRSRGSAQTTPRAPPNQRWKSKDATSDEETKGTRGRRGGGRGGRGSKKQSLSAINVQSTNEDGFIDIETFGDASSPDQAPSSDSDIKLASQFKQLDKDFLPTNLPISQFQSFQRDIGDSDDDDDTNDMASLMNAGAFTAEEISRILKCKLAQLRGLYLEQFEDLEEEYKVKRSQFIRMRGRLFRSKVPFTTNPQYLRRDDQHDVTEKFIQEEHGQFKYHQKLLQYHKLDGQRAVLHKIARQKYQEIKDKEKEAASVASIEQSKAEESERIEIDDPDLKSYSEFCEAVRKLKTVELIEPPKIIVRCEYAGELGNEPRCPDPALPLTKFCHTHILSSAKQLLFKHCGRKLASGATCDIPVLGLIDKLGCPMHHMPVVRDLSEAPEAKRIVEAKISAQPKVDSLKRAVAPLEKMVINEAVSVEHMREMISDNKGDDTDDSEEFEDELAGLPPGPSYMTIKF